VDQALATLDDLGIKFGTDKSSVDHNYLNFYERHFLPFRHKEITILEIGLLGGASLSVWEEYFPHATIVGADIDKRTLRFARPRIAIEIIDQSNIEHLTRLGLRYGPFDIIIEDGSHMWEHQITSLRTLFPFVRNGGLYIVEDLQTNFPSMAADYRGVASISCVEYLKRLVDFRVGDEKLDISKEEDAFLRTYGRAMATINFSRHVCLIEKSYREDGINDSDKPYVSHDPQLPGIPVILMAHLGGVGDKTSQAGWVRATKATQAIQGFALSIGGNRTCQILYRARSSSGVWSDWATNGNYVGSRGRADNLTGFSVRVADSDKDRFDLQAIGQFADSPNVIVKNGGSDLVSASGRHPLRGMQIILRAKP